MLETGSRLTTYVRIALRRMARAPGITLINAGGLAVAMSCTMVIVLSIRYDLGFDTHHERYERLHKLEWGDLWQPMGRLDPAAFEELPDVTAAVGLQFNQPLLSHGERHIYQSVTFAHPSVFDVFTVNLLRGDRATVLTAPYSMVLSESVAHRFFGEADPVGQVLLWDNAYPYTITGVVADAPENSGIPMEVLISMVTKKSPQFGDKPYYDVWIVAPPDYAHEPEAFAARALAFYRRHAGEPAVDARPRLVPLADAHRSEPLMKRLYVLATVGAVVLLVACVNYTNLVTARALGRARETGVRRLHGASRFELVRQYGMEAGVLVLLAWAVSVVAVKALLPACSELLGIDLRESLRPDAWLWLVGLGIGIVPALVGGVYPAFVLSAFRPADGLRETGPTSGSRARTVFVAAQFAVAAFLIVASLAVKDQLAYMDDRELGYEASGVITIPLQNRAMWERWPLLQERLAQEPRLTTTVAFGAPMGWLPSGSYWGEGETEPRRVRMLGGAPGMIQFYGMRLIVGRGLSAAADTAGACVINERAVADLGLPSAEAALGQRLRWQNDFHVYGRSSLDYEATVVGVVADFHWESLHQPIDPLILFADRGWEFSFAIRPAPDDEEQAMAAFRRVWDEVIPELPPNLQPLDERLAGLYASERRLGAIILGFAAVAVALTVAGLFGLTSLLAQQRTRSIAIRKALGASPQALLRLMTREITRVVVLGNLVCVPLALAAVHWWLEGFAYRSAPAAAVFAAAGTATLALAWATVGYHTLQVVLANPARALRHE